MTPFYRRGYHQNTNKLIEFLVHHNLSDITVDYSETDTSELTKSIETRTTVQASRYCNQLFDWLYIQGDLNINCPVIRVVS